MQEKEESQKLVIGLKPNMNLVLCKLRQRIGNMGLKQILGLCVMQNVWAILS